MKEPVSALIRYDAIRAVEEDNTRDPIDPTSKDILSLAQSIREVGLIQPLVVRKLPDGGFGLVLGFRRYVALGIVQRGRLDDGDENAVDMTVRCHVFDGITETDALTINLRENVDREALRDWEIAAAYLRLHKLGRTPNQIAADFGKSPSYVGCLIRTARNLHPDILKAWKSGDKTINVTFAMSLSTLSPPAQIEKWKSVSAGEPPRARRRALDRRTVLRYAEKLEHDTVADPVLANFAVELLRWVAGEGQCPLENIDTITEETK